MLRTFAGCVAASLALTAAAQMQSYDRLRGYGAGGSKHSGHHH